MKIFNYLLFLLFFSIGCSVTAQAGDSPEKKDSLTKKDSIRVESIYDEGLWMIGRDDKIKIFAWAQEDARIYRSDYPVPDNFLNRRARLGVVGVLETYFNFQVMIALERLTEPLQYAYVEYAQFPFAQLRIGQFKEPYSREELSADTYLDILERSIFMTNFSPAQDIGIMLHGKLFSDVVEYGFGAFNGRGKNKSDNNSDKDLAGRLDINMFKNAGIPALSGLFIGGSFTTGKQNESFKGVNVSTAGKTNFFSFNDSVTVSDNRLRTSADFEWLYGPASLKGEWDMLEYKDMHKGAETIDMKFDGWFVSGTFVITGEKKLRNKPIKPWHDFNPLKGHWGALEIAGRYEQFKASNNAIIKGFAAGSEKVNSYAVGLNWTLNRHVRFSGDYIRSDFDTPVTISGMTLENEDLFLMRFQFSY